MRSSAMPVNAFAVNEIVLAPCSGVYQASLLLWVMSTPSPPTRRLFFQRKRLSTTTCANGIVATKLSNRMSFRIEPPACPLGQLGLRWAEASRLSVRPRMGEADIREHSAHNQGEPAEPHRNGPATDRSLPPEDNSQQMDQADHGKDDRCYPRVAPAIHALASRGGGHTRSEQRMCITENHCRRHGTKGQ